MGKLRQRIQPVRDKAHIAFLHTLPCVCTGLEENIVAHHLLRVPTNERGAGMKSGDDWCISLTNDVHVDLHHCGMDERDFLRQYGVYGPALAALLYRLSGDEKACRRAIEEATEAEYLGEV